MFRNTSRPRSTFPRLFQRKLRQHFQICLGTLSAKAQMKFQIAFTINADDQSAHALWQIRFKSIRIRSKCGAGIAMKNRIAIYQDT